MSRTVKLLIAALAAAVLIAGIFLLRPAPKAEGGIARITLDGKIIEEIDLNRLTEPKTVVVEGEGGLTNTIIAEKGSIRVEHADCPDQVCVRQGAISNGTVPIVCLPNHLIIEIVGGGDHLDGATT